MKGKAINTIFHYLLILSLGVALLFAQTNKLHLHAPLGEHHSVAVTDVHIASTPHNGTHSHHGTIVVDVSSNTFVKNTNILNPLVLILLFIGFALYIPRRVYLRRCWQHKIRFTSRLYLFLPPLRAPPIK